METLGDIEETKESNENGKKYVCVYCNFKCCKKYNWCRHILTSKHIEVTKRSILDSNQGQKEQKEQTLETLYTCKTCKKIYKSRNGHWKHTQKCNHLNETINDNNILNKSKTTDKSESINKSESTDKELIMMLIKQNTELMEILKNGTHNTNITNTNSHNKAFNLNFFLNETCKNAMNINDFVDSIKLELNDLEKVGEIGYVEGISNIIIKNLNALDETERPLHCTDKKREIIYIKDQGQWEKDDDNNSRIKKTITKIANKNIKLISQFREKYPECRKSESKISDKYNKMIIEAMGGLGDNTLEKEEKIIRNITKVTTINK